MTDLYVPGISGAANRNRCKYGIIEGNKLPGAMRQHPPALVPDKEATSVVKKIPLSGERGKGLYTCVDNEDYVSLFECQWHLGGQNYPVCVDHSCGKPKLFTMHRIIMNAKPGQIVDHINGDHLDNRRENLRFVNVYGNAQNGKRRMRYRGKKTLSSYRGVTRVRGANGPEKWTARIMANRKLHRLGNFDTEVEAAEAYDRAAKELHGEYAQLNFEEVGDGGGI